MDVKSKRKLKKRTLKNLDDFRRRIRSEEIVNVTPTCDTTLEFKNIAKYNNELYTCKPLTLQLFNKTIRSKTVTRGLSSRIENADNIIKPRNGNTMTNILTNCSHQLINPIDGNSKSNMCDNNKISFGRRKRDLFKKNAFGIIVSESEEFYSINSCSPSHYGLMVLDDLTSKEDSNCRHDYLTKSSCSNSETEFGYCPYEKFMNDLPAYLKEHFPALTRGFLNKNIINLRQRYLKNGYQKKKNNTLNYSKTIVNIPVNHRELIIQNPVDYIQTGLSWEQSVQKKQSILLPNIFSPRLSEFGADNLNMILNSPHYQYFPHKLNQ